MFERFVAGHRCQLKLVLEFLYFLVRFPVRIRHTLYLPYSGLLSVVHRRRLSDYFGIGITPMH